MEISKIGRRHQINPCTRPPSSPPRLVRSRSGTNTISTAAALNASQRFNSSNRSKSTTKTRPNTVNKAEEDDKVNNPLQSINHSVQKKLPQENRQGFAYKFLHPSGGRSVPDKSPSAWALSPGRYLASPLTESLGSVRSSAKVKSSSGGGGVLKYFSRQKKVSPLQEDEFHRFRVLHNKLMQWRFANATAHTAMEATKRVAEVPTSKK